MSLWTVWKKCGYIAVCLHGCHPLFSIQLSLGCINCSRFLWEVVLRMYLPLLETIMWLYRIFVKIQWLLNFRGFWFGPFSFWCGRWLWYKELGNALIKIMYEWIDHHLASIICTDAWKKCGYRLCKN